MYLYLYAQSTLLVYTKVATYLGMSVLRCLAGHAHLEKHIRRVLCCNRRAFSVEARGRGLALAPLPAEGLILVEPRVLLVPGRASGFGASGCSSAAGGSSSILPTGAGPACCLHVALLPAATSATGGRGVAADDELDSRASAAAAAAPQLLVLSLDGPISFSVQQPAVAGQQHGSGWPEAVRGERTAAATAFTLQLQLPLRELQPGVLQVSAAAPSLACPVLLLADAAAVAELQLLMSKGGLTGAQDDATATGGGSLGACQLDAASVAGGHGQQLGDDGLLLDLGFFVWEVARLEAAAAPSGRADPQAVAQAWAVGAHLLRHALQCHWLHTARHIHELLRALRKLWDETSSGSSSSTAVAQYDAPQQQQLEQLELAACVAPGSKVGYRVDAWAVALQHACMCTWRLMCVCMVVARILPDCNLTHLQVGVYGTGHVHVLGLSMYVPCVCVLQLPAHGARACILLLLAQWRDAYGVLVRLQELLQLARIWEEQLRGQQQQRQQQQHGASNGRGTWQQQLWQPVSAAARALVGAGRTLVVPPSGSGEGALLFKQHLIAMNANRQLML